MVAAAPAAQVPASPAAATPAPGGPLASVIVVLIVASVVPLTLLQVPNMIASGFPVATLARIAGHGSVVSLVRACGLALPVMACVAPVAAVLARRRRAWPALLTGLILLAAGDLFGDSVRSVMSVAADRVLHGLGAGLALPATLALAWERPPRWGRKLARWWVVVAVASLLAAVPLMRDRMAGGDWRAALQPFPWLTAAGLAVTAVYVALTGGAGRQARAAVTPAERSQLALLAVPVAGLGVLDVGVSNSTGRSVVVAAVAAVLVLAALAMAASSDPVTGGQRGHRSRLCFPLIGACAGFVLAPTAGLVAMFRPLAAGPAPALRALWLPLAAAAAACLLGAGVAWLAGRRGITTAAGKLAGGGDGGDDRLAAREGNLVAGDGKLAAGDGGLAPVASRLATGGAGAAAARGNPTRGTCAGDSGERGRGGRAGAHAARRRRTKKDRSRPAAGTRSAGPRSGVTRSAGPRSGVTRSAGPRSGVTGAAGRGALRCVLAGLACAAAGLVAVAAHMAGAASSQPELAAACALLCGGLAMALSAAVAEATPAGSLSGLSMALAGALTGYLVCGAIQIRLVNSAAGRTGTVAQVLTRAAGWWELAAAALALATAAAVFFVGRARGAPEDVAMRG